jgi:hypothetical protein
VNQHDENLRELVRLRDAALADIALGPRSLMLEAAKVAAERHGLPPSFIQPEALVAMRLQIAEEAAAKES